MITTGNNIGGDDTISSASYDIGNINSDKSEIYHGIMLFF
jgi:hypothetical protein